MRPRDDRKRQAILATAASLFSSQPFHKVKLDDVAAAAHVGKGTLYIYFSSKEDLYFTLLYEGFAELVDRLDAQLADARSSVRERLRQIVAALVQFAFSHPEMFQVMRTASVPLGGAEWEQKRGQLYDLITAALQKGLDSGELQDSQPRLTALYIPGIVRSVMLYGPRDLDQEQLINHILNLLEHGLCQHA